MVLFSAAMMAFSLAVVLMVLPRRRDFSAQSFGKRSASVAGMAARSTSRAILLRLPLLATLVFRVSSRSFLRLSMIDLASLEGPRRSSSLLLRGGVSRRTTDGGGES